MYLQDGIKNPVKTFLQFIKQHNEYRKKTHHRCKVASFKKNPKTGEIEVYVQIEGMKHQLPIKFTPDELIANDDVIKEFSQTDVRAITFCALEKVSVSSQKPRDKFKVISQEISAGKTIYAIAEEGFSGELRISAQELFSSDILKHFSFEDIRNVIYTAIFEHATQEMESF